MLSAIAFAVTGVLATLFIGDHYFGLNYAVLSRTIVVANIVGFLDLIFILNAQNVPFFKKYFIPSISWTWINFVSIFCAATYFLSSDALTIPAFAALLLPLIFSTGFCIIAFGPIQDKIVTARQRKARGK